MLKSIKKAVVMGVTGLMIAGLGQSAFAAEPAKNGVYITSVGANSSSRPNYGTYNNLVLVGISDTSAWGAGSCFAGGGAIAPSDGSRDELVAVAKEALLHNKKVLIYVDTGTTYTSNNFCKITEITMYDKHY